MIYRIGLVAFICLVGFSACRKENKKVDEPTSPLERLITGNDYFVETEPKDRILTLKKGQLPYAVIVSCSDSRVSPEIIFHETLGSLFVVRTAGNIIGDYEMGSIEYAAENFHSSLIVILGHEDCGAVGAYIKGKYGKEKGKIQEIINYIKAEIEVIDLPDTLTMEVLYPLTVRANVLHGLHELNNSEVLREKIINKKIRVVGAIYHMSDGHVDFFEDDSPPH